MNKVISKILLSIVFCLGTIHCSKISFNAIDQGSTDGSTPVVEPPVPPQPARPKLDLLIVMDNSSSMLDTHAIIESKLIGFTEQLEARNIDYRIAVTTTDARTDVAKEFAQTNGTNLTKTPRGFGGKILSFNKSNFISNDTVDGESLVLSSLDRSLEASCGTLDTGESDYWKDDVAEPEVCSTDWEEPTKVIKQFLKQKNTVNAGFLRSNVPLVALIITDEDIDDSTGKGINLNMAEELSSIRALRSNFKAYGIIAQEQDVSRCQANWSGETSQKVGEFITLSGGVHHSICDSDDYTSIFDEIAASL
ncbi:MAG: hypothetical protein HAW63_02710 [Bdellovibrionaceae bacterium]|nr:hypothetical protein [Pseudobdellovibrionaceae bacterium]